MVSCHSCGRIIASGTIRCTGCQTPFHLNCSHRYKISPNGVFSVCCGGGNQSPFHQQSQQQQQQQQRNNYNAAAHQRNNKRKQQQQLQSGVVKQQNTFNNSQSAAAVAAQVTQQQQQVAAEQQQQPEEDTMRYSSKVQRTNSAGLVAASNNAKMVAADDKPIIEVDDGQEDIIEILDTHQDNFNEDLELDDEDDIFIEEHITNSTFRPSNPGVTVKTEPGLDSSQTSQNRSSSSITLETVWQGISSLQSSIGNISNSLDTVSTHLNTFDPRMNELETTLNAIKTKTANFEGVQSDVSGLRDQLKDITSELEAIKAQKEEQDKSLNFSDILIEVKQREMRARNLIVYNVPEDNLRISQDYSTVEDLNKFNDLVVARDNSRAREILNNVPNLDLEEIDTRRLGRPRDGWCRPLRVTLQCHEDVIQVMRNKRAVSNQFTVKTDLTQYQRDKIKELREQLERENDKNNPSLTIRFVSGEPKIVPIRRQKEE